MRLFYFTPTPMLRSILKHCASLNNLLVWGFTKSGIKFNTNQRLVLRKACPILDNPVLNAIADVFIPIKPSNPVLSEARGDDRKLIPPEAAHREVMKKHETTNFRHLRRCISNEPGYADRKTLAKRKER